MASTLYAVSSLFSTPPNQEPGGRRAHSRRCYHGSMQEEERFIPKGAIAFFVAMIVLYAAIWFLLIGIMIRRG